MRKTLGLEVKGVPNVKRRAGNGGGKPKKQAGGLSRDVPLSLPPPAVAAQVATWPGMLALPPHVGEDPGQVRHPGSVDCDWVEGPSSCAPDRGGSRCTQRAKVSLHFSLFILPSGG